MFSKTKLVVCLTQLLTCFNIWTKAIDHKGPVKIVYIEFKKTFDIPSYVKLAETLKGFDASSNLLACLIDFFN